MGKFNPEEHMIKMGTNKDGTPRMYLETKWRLVWFREDHPKGKIATDLLATEPAALFKASIIDETGELLGTGHGSAIDKGGAVWAGRGIEKAETAAIGRALAHAGYGTQFTDEDEDDHLADAPVEKRGTNGNSKPATKEPHWSTDATQVEALNAKAFDELMLSGVQVLKALDVQVITKYTGTKKQAWEAVLAYHTALNDKPATAKAQGAR